MLECCLDPMKRVDLGFTQSMRKSNDCFKVDCFDPILAEIGFRYCSGFLVQSKIEADGLRNASQQVRFVSLRSILG